MKKTKFIQLVLITAALASCDKKEKEKEWNADESKTYIRADSTAPYSRTHHGMGSTLLWFYAFRSYGNYTNGRYTRAGYYSGAINHRSNVGTNGFKSSVSRGGFGRSGFSVHS
jgi:hypothetical protein